MTQKCILCGNTKVMYQNEIIQDLKTKYNYHNKIALISPKPRVLKI